MGTISCTAPRGQSYLGGYVGTPLQPGGSDQAPNRRGFSEPPLSEESHDQTITSFGAYNVTTCEGTDITDYNKRMFFWTRLRPKIRAAVQKCEDYITFDVCL